MKFQQLVAAPLLFVLGASLLAWQSPSTPSGGSGGAVPESTQAEKALQQEQDFHARLTTLSASIDNIAQSMVAMRRNLAPQSLSDIQRIERELTVAEKEAADMSLTGVSPLAQLQREEQQDRLGDLRAMLESLRTRRQTGVPVFGLSAFQTPSPIPNSRLIPTTYRLRVGDKLEVMVTSKLGAGKTYPLLIDHSGHVSLPGIGKTLAAGKTGESLRTELQRKLSVKFKQLQVSLTIESYSVIQVQVMGEVVRPGVYNLPSTATLTDALRAAGGPTEHASFRQVSVSRSAGTRKTVDLYGFLLYGKRNADVALGDGDVVLLNPVGSTVVMLGELVRPGRYEMLGPMKLGDAIKMAGGAKPTAYSQSVQVDRVEEGQFRELLSQKLDKTEVNSFVLKPGDEITINPVHSDRTNRVSINGPVKSPGVYALTEGMKVKDLINVAQGFLPEQEVYSGRADLLRYDPMQGARIVTFNLSKALSGDTNNNLVLQKYDRLYIYNPDQVVFRPRIVTLMGAVSKPGSYKRTPGMRVNDAIAAAGGTLPDAFLDRANLVRHLDGDKTEIVAIDLQAALSGNPDSNPELKDRDEITIFTHAEAKWQERSVKVEGAVQRPGIYQRSENMRLSDVLFLSGGILPEANQEAQIARIDKNGVTQIITVDLTTLKPKAKGDELIFDRDVVTIAESNVVKRNVQIVYLTGEVMHPGPYAINPLKDRISDIIARAGGFTPMAHRGGTLFLRRKDQLQNNVQEQEADLLLRKSRLLSDKEFAMQLAKMGIGINNITSGGNTDIVKPNDAIPPQVQNTNKSGADVKGTSDRGASGSGEVQSDTAMGPTLKVDIRPEDQVKRAVLTEMVRISVDIDVAMSKLDSPDNLVLVGGDRLFIPQKSSIITVVGAVLHPHRFAAGESGNISEYIAKSGGYAQDAAPRYTVVIRANGDAYPVSKVKKVMPGDMIVVPTTGLIDVTRKIDRVSDVTKVIADVLSSVFILTRL